MKLELKLDQVKDPCCCNCGHAIPKRTRMIMFGQQNYRDERFEGRPKTREEAQKYTNGIVTSSRRSADGSYLLSVNVWDGESYVDEFFCTNRCAISYAHNMARVQTHGRK